MFLLLMPGGCEETWTVLPIPLVMLSGDELMLNGNNGMAGISNEVGSAKITDPVTHGMEVIKTLLTRITPVSWL